MAEENTFVLKLSDGADIMQGLEKFVKDQKIEEGWFVGVEGRIKDFELVSHEQRGNINRLKFVREFDVNSISGKIQLRRSGAVEKNIKISVSSTGFTPNSGQLLNGKAAGNLEISVRKLDFSKMIKA